MEHEFRIRAALAHGGIEAAEPFAIYDTAELSQQRGVRKSAADDSSVASVDGRMVGMVVLQTIWSGLSALWSAVKLLVL